MGVSCGYETVTAKAMGALTDRLMDACETLAADLEGVPAEAEEAMRYCHRVLVPAMEQARAVADELENITAKTHWPFPVYSELLFSV